MLEIELPYNYTPRKYQWPFFDAMDSGIKRAILVHHRRAGKDLACFNFMIKRAYSRVGNYFYMFPELQQADKAIWTAKTKDGKGYLDCIPREIIKNINNHEMYIELNNAGPKDKNGSIIRMVNANIDRIVGSGPAGIVISEYSLISPEVWSKVEPMIIEQEGWAVFNGTPRGENHFYKMYQMAKDNPYWYASKLSIEDTGAINMAEIERMRSEGTTPEDVIQQEYFCSFRGSKSGAYYVDMLDRIEKQVTEVPYEDTLPVHTAWDLGMNDATCIWFYQTHMNQIRIIDCYSASGEGLQHYVNYLRSKPYKYGDHYAPHDIKVRELGTGKSRIELAAQMGIKFKLTPNIKVEDGIECVRSTLSRCWFDKIKTKDGMHALSN